MKRIILTGGGTAGHVTPNIALLPRLKELGYDIQYIGSYTGIEKELIEPFGIPYHGISSGKLRRYFSVQNFTDPFRVLKGFRSDDYSVSEDAVYMSLDKTMLDRLRQGGVVDSLVFRQRGETRRKVFLADSCGWSFRHWTS